MPHCFWGPAPPDPLLQRYNTRVSPSPLHLLPPLGNPRSALGALHIHLSRSRTLNSSIANSLQLMLCKFYRLVDKGYKVFGVEISEQAVGEIFTEAGLFAKVIPVGNDFKLYEVLNK